MASFSDLEPRFRALAGPASYVRLDFQWGAAGEHWNVPALRRDSTSRELGILLESAGQQLRKAATRHPDLQQYGQYDAREAWFRALKDLSGEFRANDFYAVDEASGHIFTGRVDNLPVASANLCLVLETRYPMDEKNSGASVTLVNSQVGVLNTGQIAHVNSIEAYAGSIRDAGQSQVAEALQQVAGAVRDAGELEDLQKMEVLEQLEELARQVAAPSDERSKPSVLKALWTSVSTTLGTAASIAQIWTTWGPRIEAFIRSLH